MTKPASLLLLPVALLSLSCAADGPGAPDGPTEDAADPAIRAGIPSVDIKLDPVSAAHTWIGQHLGRCADACFDVWAGSCDPCAEGQDAVACDGVSLSCVAADDAHRGKPAGIAACWRSCEGIEN